LLKWQKTQRLVGSADPRWIIEHLFLDSLLFLKVLPAHVGSLLDLGAGAGVPGIPIKLVRRDLALVLVESRRRRASFLSAVIRELGLDGVRVINARAEKIRERIEVDAVVMRCAGPVEELRAAARTFVRPGGMIVAAGPPEARPSGAGHWIEVADPVSGRGRRFLVLRCT